VDRRGEQERRRDAHQSLRRKRGPDAEGGAGDRQGGKQIHFRGKNLLVWKKQTDGSWKIFRYMYDEIPAKK
jgi:hypothetical protein